MDTHLARARIAQISELIDCIEDGIDADHDEVASLRMALAIERRRLRCLTQPSHQCAQGRAAALAEAGRDPWLRWVIPAGVALALLGSWLYPWGVA